MAQREISGRHACTIYYEDTDFTGFVYHANYLKYCERAREHLLGIDKLRQLFDRGIHFVVHHLDASFHAPARHGDQLNVQSTVILSSKPRLRFEQTILRVSHEKTATKIFSAKIDIAVLNADNRPVRLPQWAVELIGKQDQ